MTGKEIKKALWRLKSTKDYLREKYQEDLKNCKYPELKPLIKKTYEDNKKAFDIAIKAIEDYNRQQAEITAITDKLESLLCHATGSKLSYSTYPLDTMYSAVNDYIEDCCYEAIKDYKEDLITKIVNTPTQKQSCGVFYLNGVANRQHEIIDIIKGCEGKEMVGEGNVDCNF